MLQELEGKPSDAESSSDESDSEVWKEVRREARERRELAKQATPILTKKTTPITAAATKPKPFKLNTTSSK